jgi:hypothetical protein
VHAPEESAASVPIHTASLRGCGILMRFSP